MFNRFELEDVSHLNKLSRHIEHSELTEAALNDRAFCKPESIEEEVSRNIEYELLHKAIAKLPEVQRRRLLLYFFGEMTYEQIATLEGCTKRAVKFSVDIAIEKQKKDFGIFLNSHYTNPFSVNKQVKEYQNPFTCFPLCGENRTVP